MIETVVQFVQTNPLGVFSSTVALIAVFQTHRQSRISKQLKERAADIEERQRMVEVDNKLHDAWVLLGGNVESESIEREPSRKELNEAKRILTTAEKLAPNYGPIHRQWANFYYAKGNIVKARHHAEMAVTLASDQVENYNTLAVILSEQEELEESIKYLKKAMEIEPDYTLGPYNMGVAYRKLEKYDEAMEYFQKAVEIDDEYDPIYHEMGFICGQAGKHKEAIEHFGRARRLDPDDSSALFNIAWNYGELGLFDKALEIQKEAYERAPDDQATIENMGFYCIKTGNFSDGEKYLNKALELNPTSISAYEYLSSCYWGAGKFDLVIKVLETAIKLDPENPGAKNWEADIEIAKQNLSKNA